MIRELKLKDKEEYLNIVNYFTRNIKPVINEQFEKWFNYSKLQNSHIYVLIEDNEIIGTGKILIEYKFHNNLSKCGHIEDIVIHQKYRGKG
jgi:hypothetical protein